VAPLLDEAAIGAARQFLFVPRPAAFERYPIRFEFNPAAGTSSASLARSLRRHRHHFA